MPAGGAVRVNAPAMGADHGGAQPVLRADLVDLTDCQQSLPRISPSTSFGWAVHCVSILALSIAHRRLLPTQSERQTRHAGDFVPSPLGR